MTSERSHAPAKSGANAASKAHAVLRNLSFTALVLVLTSAICAVFHLFVSTDSHVPLIFVLAVVIISRYTDGYWYGIAASFVAVIGVNCIFTYPYLQLDFTITGYPLTFAVMLTVAVIVSALTTQIKQQEQMRLHMEREQMRANLLRSVSHDIRTPLTSIVGSASAILDNYDSLDDDQKKTLTGDIRTEAQWLNRIVENILSITRMSGDARISKSEELAEEIVSSAVQKFKKHSPDIAVTVRIPDEVLIVPMDPILIEQVLSNLIENAATHGVTTTKISLSVRKTKDGFAAFSVRDNGQGIPPALLPHLFDYSIRHSAGPTGDGKRNMGLGLSVCSAVVKAHGGHLSARNTGDGAEFIFCLPLSKEEIV